MFRTKAQQESLCHSCPFAKAANLLGDTVTLFILKELLSGKKSFGEIEARLKSVSTRTISEKLKNLESVGIITREEVCGKPTRVYYTIDSKAGTSFKKVELALLSFGDEFFRAQKAQ